MEQGSIRSQPRWLEAIKAAGVATSCVLLAGLAWRIAVVFRSEPRWLLSVAFLLGYASADVLSGTVHWFCDSFFSPRTPLIGRAVIFPFRDHHDHPGRIVEYRFLEQDTSNFFLLLLPLAWFWWSDLPSYGRPAALYGGAYLLALCCGSFGTNLFHKWAHDPGAPRAARWLQRTGLILNPERHWRHHRDPSRAFCVTSGWMNRVLDPIHFFSRLERVVRALLPSPVARSRREAEQR